MKFSQFIQKKRTKSLNNKFQKSGSRKAVYRVGKIKIKSMKTLKLLAMPKLLFLVLFSTTLSFVNYGQWDYVNFPAVSQNSQSYGAAICPTTDEVFSLEKSPTSQYQVIEYVNGILNNFTALMPVGTVFSQNTYNHITCDDKFVYLVSNTTTGQGKLHFVSQTNIAPNPPSLLSTITNSNGNTVHLRGVTVKNGFIFIVGYTSATTSDNIVFGPSTTLTPVTSSSKVGFIGKFSLTSMSWVWVNNVTGKGSLEDVAIDNSGNIFLTGSLNGDLEVFSTAASFLYPFPSTNSGSFLISTNSTGNYNSTWGCKQFNTGGTYDVGVDVKIDPDNNAVYHLVNNKIQKHSNTGTGNLIWTKNLNLHSSTSYQTVIHQIAINNCEEIFATGETAPYVIRPVNNHYFGASIDKTSTVTNWVSNSTGANYSQGTAALVKTSNKINFLGYYYDGGSTTSMKIDSETPSTYSIGGFIGRAEKSCCKPLPITLNDMTVCIGASPPPYLYIYPQLGGIPLSQLTIVWKFNGTIITGANSPVQFLTGLGGSTPVTGTYCVEVTFPDCTTPVVSCMNLTLTNCPTPNCEIEPIMKINAEDCVFHFENFSIIGSGTSVIGYLWDFGDGTTSTDENPYHVYKFGGNYTVTFTVFGRDNDGNCCSETITEVIHVDGDCEKTECTIKPGMNFEVLGNTVILSDHSFGIGYTNIVGYKWEIDGILISTLSNFAIQLPAGGHNVCLTVYAFNNLGECCEVQICEYIEIEMCEEVDEITIIKKKSQLNYSDKTPSYQLNIHPNPTNGKVDIDFNTDMKNGSAKIIITDLTGNIILEQNINSHRVQINMNSWESGLYFCKIIDGEQTLTKKIIKN